MKRKTQSSKLLIILKTILWGAYLFLGSAILWATYTGTKGQGFLLAAHNWFWCLLIVGLPLWIKPLVKLLIKGFKNRKQIVNNIKSIVHYDYKRTSLFPRLRVRKKQVRVNTDTDGTEVSNRSYRQSGGSFLDVSPIIGLPYKFTIMGESYNFDHIEDVQRLPKNFSSFTINGTKYYFNNYYRLCAAIYEEKGYSNIANALRAKADELEDDPIYGDFMRKQSKSRLQVTDIKKLSDSHAALYEEIDSRIKQNRQDKLENKLPQIDTDEIIRQEQEWQRKQRGLSPAENELLQIDGMEGHAFEYWCADLLKRTSFINVSVTPGSNDQGVDVLAEKDGIKYAVQCKCYSSDLGNTPIQEVNAGKTFYNCHVGVVMTNRYFTKGAKDLAKSTRTLLWDRDYIKELLERESESVL